MGVKIKRVGDGETPLTIVHRILVEHCGYNTAQEKAHVANGILGTNVDKIEDLSVSQLSVLTQRLIKESYNGIG